MKILKTAEGIPIALYTDDRYINWNNVLYLLPWGQCTKIVLIKYEVVIQMPYTDVIEVING